ncbi:MAG: SPOR domain-containing protein [Candidatus Xenobia bacterium]
MAKRVDPGGVHRESDGFWTRVLVITIVVIWVSLVGGNWAGRWAIEHGKFSGHHHASRETAASEPVQRPHVEPTVAPTVAASPSPEESSSASPVPHQTVTLAPAATPTPEGSPSAAASSSPAASPSADSTNWSLQVGVFSSDTNAQKAAADLRDKGYTVEVVPEHSAGATMYAVRVGHFPSRDALADEQEKMKAQGYNPIPVSH